MSIPKISVFNWVPKEIHGSVRDFRVRWALEELGLPYEERVVDFAQTESAAYLKLCPFGLIPAYEEGDLVLFESSAIVAHIAEKSDVLQPSDPNARARMLAWMFAAANTLEPMIMVMVDIDFFSEGEEWGHLKRPAAFEAVNVRLADLANWLKDREYLEDRFTAADLLMAASLDMQRGLLDGHPVLKAYHARCLDRPAYRRAVAAQISTFLKNEPSP